MGIGYRARLSGERDFVKKRMIQERAEVLELEAEGVRGIVLDPSPRRPQDKHAPFPFPRLPAASNRRLYTLLLPAQGIEEEDRKESIESKKALGEKQKGVARQMWEDCAPGIMQQSTTQLPTHCRMCLVR